MNAGQSLVRAYLHLNGYLTDSELPVIEKEKDGTFRVTTDIDLVALRFPHARRRVARGRPGLHDDLFFKLDPELDVSEDSMDLIIAEVKEGRPRVNPALRSRETLTTALTRLGCCPPDDLPGVVGRLRRDGETRVEPAVGGVACRIRILAFGDGEPGARDGYRVFQLRRVAAFVQEHLRRYRKVLHPVDLADPALGVLHLLEKLSGE